MNSKSPLNGINKRPREELGMKRPHTSSSQVNNNIDIEDESRLEMFNQKVIDGVGASAKVGTWKVLNYDKNEAYTVRVGSYFRPLSIVCHDRNNKRIPFESVPELVIKLTSRGPFLAQVRTRKVEITPDKLTLQIKGLVIKSSMLDRIRPNYEATLHISTPDESLSVALQCRVIPEAPKRISLVHPTKLREVLLPGQIIEELALEVFDEYGNHVKEDESISLRFDGISLQDGSGIIRGGRVECTKTVDANGHVDLSNALKVTSGYGKRALLSVISKMVVIYELWFQTEIRELRAVQEVQAEKTQQETRDSVSQAQCETSTSQGSKGSTAPINDLPVLKTPKLEPRDDEGGSSQILCSKESSLMQELEDDIANSALQRSKHERSLQKLQHSLLLNQQDILQLQAALGPHHSIPSSLCGYQHSTLEQIKSRSQSAAAVVCKMLEEEQRRLGIVGVAALLGTVDSIDLSRILAQYLGKHQMLAIVCKNYEASHSLQEFATDHGLSINGSYNAFFLDEMRNPQGQLLPLQHPTLPNDNKPRGFLGYAVNLISIATSHVQWRSRSGHDLRETLFYRLFGKLQVYKDSDCMMEAQSCLEEGAVSLDGGMMRGNGLISLGHGEPKILFPVVKESMICPDKSYILEAKILEQTKIKQRINEENEALQKLSEKLQICLDKYKSHTSQSRGH